MAGAEATPAATQIPRRRQTDGRWTIDSATHISISNQQPSPLVWKKVQSKCTTHSLPGATSGEQVNQAGGVAGGRIREAGPRTKAATAAGAAKRATHQARKQATQAVVAQIWLTQSLIKSHDSGGGRRLASGFWDMDSSGLIPVHREKILTT